MKPGGRFDLEIASALVRIEVAAQRALDLAGPRVVPLDPIAVVAVHDAHEFGELRGGARVQSLTQSGGGSRKVGNDIGDLASRVFKARRFDTIDALRS